ncbi:MAG: S-methyl-5'-thioinosine phosphorylase [Betaproteobacteria bacterium]|nr:S-methyl-5'-thioinosine phosphorylase [Betaproteobacteria bacterium]
MLAIIGGTGLTNLANLTITHREVVRTPYGEPSGHLTFGQIGPAQMVFLARHGYAHTYAPHEVNYRANIWALAETGVTRILAVNAVGGIAAQMGPGVLAVPDQLIDYTHGRRHTFFEGGEPVTHIDFTEPFCARARNLIARAARDAGLPVVEGGTLGVTQGPRLETRAEILRLKNDGCALVGMTTMPEAALAREKKLSYATLALSMNHAAGLGTSAGGIKLADADAVLAAGMEKVRAILARAVELHAQLPAHERGID